MSDARRQIPVLSLVALSVGCAGAGAEETSTDAAGESSAATTGTEGGGEESTTAGETDDTGEPPPPYENGRIICADNLVTQQGPESTIVSFAPDGSDARVHVEVGFNTMPSYSRDGQRFVFVSDAFNPQTGMAGVQEIWEMDLNSGMSRPLTATAPGTLNHTPAYSHDGQQITFSRKAPDQAHKEVFVMDGDGNDPTQLTQTTELGPFMQGSHHASFSPDSETMVYASTQSGSIQIWRMNADGTDQESLTDGLGADFPNANVPSFSWDGEWVVFWAGIEAQYGEIWRMRPDGSEQEQLTDTTDPVNSDDPIMSPDNQWIVYGSHPNGPRSMFLQAIGGGSPTDFPAPDEAYSRCHWQVAPAQFASLATMSPSLSSGDHGRSSERPN